MFYIYFLIYKGMHAYIHKYIIYTYAIILNRKKQGINLRVSGHVRDLRVGIWEG